MKTDQKFPWKRGCGFVMRLNSLLLGCSRTISRSCRGHVLSKTPRLLDLNPTRRGYCAIKWSEIQPYNAIRVVVDGDEEIVDFAGKMQGKGVCGFSMMLLWFIKNKEFLYLIVYFVNACL